MSVKVVNDRNYIDNLFNNLSKAKELPVSVHIENSQHFSKMSFSYRKKGVFNILVEDKDNIMSVDQKIDIVFVYEEVLFKFSSLVIEMKENQCIIKKPECILTTSNRLVKRHKINEDENVSVSIPGLPEMVRPTDISAKGLSFTYKEKILSEGQVLTNIKITLPDSSQIIVDAEVKRIHEFNNSFIYGLAFRQEGLLIYRKLFNYILTKSYSSIKSLSNCSSEEIINLYTASNQLDIQAGDSSYDNYFIDKINHFDKLKDKPTIFSGIVQTKENKLQNIGSFIRLYSRTFLGQQLLSTPESKSNTKAKSDIQIALADIMLNHPYFEYCLIYNETDLASKVQFNEIHKFINDNSRMQLDEIELFICNLENYVDLSLSDDYYAVLTDNPDSFLDYCKKMLSQIEVDCYDYKDKASLSLQEIKMVYESLGLFVSRKLWEIHLGSNLIAYAIAEAFSDGVSVSSFNDICRLYFVDDAIDVELVLSVILPELKGFYERYGKSVFNICFGKPNDYQIINIDGLDYTGTVQRVIMNRDGLSQFKKLLATNAEHYTKYYPLSHTQKAIWYMEKVYPKTSIGIIAGNIKIIDTVNVELFEKAINLLIAQNEALRIRLIDEDGEPFQFVKEYEFEKIDFFDFSYDGGLNDSYDWEDEKTQEPFEVLEGKLYYFAILKRNENEFVYFMKTHHLISDAWSMVIIINEVVETYYKLKNYEDIYYNKKPSYMDYVINETEYKYTEKFLKDKVFWEGKFKTVPACNSIKKRPKRFLSTNAKRKTFIISNELLEQIVLFCKEFKTSVPTLFIAVMALYMSKISSKEDIIVAMPILNRSNIKEKETMGMFISTIPLRIDVDSNISFESYIYKVSKEIMECLKHQKYPYDLLQKFFREKHKSVNIHDVYVSYQNAKLDKEVQTYKYKARWHRKNHQIDSFMFNISDREDQGEYVINIDYLEQIFSAVEIEEIYKSYISILKHCLENSSKNIEEIPQIQPSWRSDAINKETEVLEIRVSATFTSEPIEDHIKWWCNSFRYDTNIEFAGYNQVFQELLNPDSGLTKNKNGINVLLVRFEDWLRNDNSVSDELRIIKLKEVFEDFKKALENFTGTAPLITALFPLNPQSSLSEAILDTIQDLNIKFKELVLKSKNTHLIDLNKISRLYSIEEDFDHVKDQEGHMPFSEELYAAMGTEIARKICTLKKQYFKVFVLDCDNTLWKGVCAEDGALGVKIEGAYKELQEFMLKKRKEGMLLAVCSKNNENDVYEVFEKNPGMILNKNDITAKKINWKEKSENIKEIAKDLNLGLDSFIFIDDSPLECSKMIQECPKVFTLQLPPEENILMFIKNFLTFDKGNLTREDMQRADMYEAEQKRNEMKSSKISLEEFLKNLNIKVSMREIVEDEVERAAQLTQRTNQFNLSTIRRTEEEIRKLLGDSETKCFVIEASDKFGDYGIIGLVILAFPDSAEKKLFIDTFLLSCRILGRSVEYAILVGIRKFAKTYGAKEFEVVFYPTEKNKPILDFLENQNWNVLEKSEKYIRYEASIDALPEETEYVEFYYNDVYKKSAIEQAEDMLQQTVTGKNDKEAISEKVFALDHVAIAVKSMEQAKSSYTALGYKSANSVYDPLQNSYLSMCFSDKYFPIEFVAPVNEKSPSYNKVQVKEEVPYHTCYKVPNIKKFLEEIKDIEYEVISDEKPAILFNNQKVAFIMVKKVGLIELVETNVELDNKSKNNKYIGSVLKLVVNNLETAVNFYKILGYTEYKTVKDTKKNVLITSLKGYYSEKIELINPLSKDTDEYEFLKRNGAGIYKIDFETSDLIENNLDVSKEFEFCAVKEIEKTRYNEFILPLYKNMSYLLNDYEAPKNEIEEKLVKIWQDVLKVEDVGTNNDFFELGGDSLKAVIIIGKIHKDFGIRFILKDFFDISNIKQMADKILRTAKNSFKNIKPVGNKDYYELSSAQRRMYILAQMEDEATGYNESYTILFEGKLDKRKLQYAFDRCIKRHESFRTGFEVIDGIPIQKIYDKISFEIECINDTGRGIKKIIRKFCQGI